MASRSKHATSRPCLPASQPWAKVSAFVGAPNPLRVQKWVDDKHSGPRDVLRVPCHQGQPVYQGRRREKRIDHGQRIGNVHSAPGVCYFPRNRKNPLFVSISQPDRPSLKRARRRLVPLGDAFNAPADLAQHQNAEEQSFVGLPRKPAQQVPVSARSFPQLGNNVRIKKVHQSDAQIATKVISSLEVLVLTDLGDRKQHVFEAHGLNVQRATKDFTVLLLSGMAVLGSSFLKCPNRAVIQISYHQLRHAINDITVEVECKPTRGLRGLLAVMPPFVAES